MAHISTRTTRTGVPFSEKHATFGADAATIAQCAAGRYDLIVTVADGIANGTALFAPATAEIEVTAELFPRVRWAEGETLSDRLVWLDNLAGAGALLHEAGHARFSVYVPGVLLDDHGWTRREVDVWTVLEEGRIERKILETVTHLAGTGGALSVSTADAALALRTCAFEVTVKDFRLSTETRYEAAAAGTLILSRIDGGTLDRAVAADVWDAVEAVLGADDLAALREVWNEFQTLPQAAHEDPETIRPLIRRWLEIVGVDPDAGDEGGTLVAVGVAGEGEGSGEGGEGGEGEGSGSGEGAGESLRRAVGAIAAETDNEATEERGGERAERRSAAREADAKRRTKGAKAAEKATREGIKTTEQMGLGSDGQTASYGESVAYTKPVTAKARRGAVALGKALARIDYMDRQITEVASIVPPGRLNTRRMVGHAAAKAQGRASRSPLFVAKKRRHTDHVPLTIGIIQDVSGSMGGAVEPVGTTAWMLTDASLRIDAQVATVLMGESYEFSRLPGQHDPSQIRLDSAPEGYEHFTGAFLALDSALNLLDGDGARLLVLASDGYYGGTHETFCDSALRLCRERGVAVIWLRFHGSQDNHGVGQVVDCRALDAVGVAEAVGREALAALKRAKPRSA